MKTTAPAYYTQFHCLGGGCRHNCCIGWEIDIDEECYARYQAERSPFGERLRRGIDTSSGQPSFRLGAGERCVFLNGEGLCEIILNLGEEALCEICDQHPRYRHFYADRVEIGLGLCCEEACRLILSQQEPVRLTVIADDGEESISCEEEEEFFAVRDRMLAILQDRRLSYDERAENLRRFGGLRPDSRTPSDWAAFYRSLERMDTAWDACLDRLEGCEVWQADGGRDLLWEQLAVYFLLRHTPAALDDGLLAPRIALCLHAVAVLRHLSAGADLEALCELCRLYSCEIEYSEENTEALTEELIRRREEDEV